VRQTTCTACASGTASAAKGQAKCTSCRNGKFADAQGSRSCKNCAHNTYSTVGQSGCGQVTVADILSAQYPDFYNLINNQASACYSLLKSLRAPNSSPQFTVFAVSSVSSVTNCQSHFAVGQVSSSSLTSTSLVDVAGNSISVTTSAGAVFINGDQLLSAVDLQAANGVVHEVSSGALPS